MVTFENIKDKLLITSPLQLVIIFVIWSWIWDCNKK